MKKQIIAAIFILMTCFMVSLVADEKVVADKNLTPEEQVDLLFKKWDNPGSPGAAVAIIRDGMVIYRKGFGSAQLEYNIPITPSTIFHVASVSKQFPAFAITMLEEQGKLSADDDIRDYLPWMPDFGKTVTIRHLLNHTSGIRDQWELLILSGWRMEDVITQKDILYLLKRQRELNFDPGEEYLYSNSGFTLLSEIVAKVSGKPFVEWVDENIFKPLGMDSSHFHIDHQQIVKNRAYSYQEDPKRGLVRSILNYANVGATSLFTTVEDMANWMRNYSEKRVGNDQMIARMFEQGLLNNGEKINYGRGLGVGIYKGLKYIGHGGADAGFRSSMDYFPEEKFGVVVLSNLASFNPSQLSRQIVDIYLADRFKIQPEERKPVVRKAIRLSKKQLQQFEGNYWLSRSKLLRQIKQEGKTLFYVRSEENRSELIPFGKSAFYMKEFPDVTVEFLERENGKSGSIRVTVGKELLDGTRMEPFNPSPTELNAYSGGYRSEEIEVEFRLTVDEKGLFLDYKKQDDDNRLQPLIMDVFAFTGGSTLSFKRDSQGKIVGFTVDTGRVRNLKFEKVEP